MEFVFAVEDRFDVRIPEERLDPRQAGVTLEQLATLLDEAVAAKARRRCRQRLARAPGAPVVVSGSGVVSPIGNDLARIRRGAVRRQLGACGRMPSTCPASTFPRCRSRRPISTPPRSSRRRACRSIGRRRWRWPPPTTPPRGRGLADGSFDRERLGIFWGSGMAGAATFETTCRTVYAERRRMRPTSVVTTMPNAPAAELALRFGARGAALAYACACASSAVAIGEAMRAIRAGWIDIAIAGGSESLLTPGVVASWQAMRVLAPLPAGGRATRPRRGVPAVRRRPRRLRRSARPPPPSSSSSRRTHAARGAAPSMACSPATRRTATASTSPTPTPPGRPVRCSAALADAGLPAARSAISTPTARRRSPATQPRPNRSPRVFGRARRAGELDQGDPRPPARRRRRGRAARGGARARRRAAAADREHDAVDPAFAIDLVTGAARPAPGLRHAMSSSFAFGGTNAVLIASRIG